MKNLDVKFIGSFYKLNQLPKDSLPQIAFAGRSNVGKSSLINKLLNRRALAKTSSTPGKTRLINFFLINKEIIFVDLPGYGYAKVSKTERNQWGKMMESYFSHSIKLKAVIFLQDIRRDQSEKDREMIDILNHYNISIIMVLTKSDKFSRNQRIKRIKEIERDLPDLEVAPIPFSVPSGLGVDELWDSITDAMGCK